jgi:serine/threonine protein phosphatase PrpC
MDQEQDITAPIEAEELEAGWAAKASATPRCYAYIAFGAKTDLGRVRENNEDKFDFLEPDDVPVLATKGRVYAVADGMGGHSAGQIASELSLNMFIRSYYADSNPNVEASLQKAVREANSYVVDVARTIPGRNGMGATLTAMTICSSPRWGTAAATCFGTERCNSSRKTTPGWRSRSAPAR